MVELKVLDIGNFPYQEAYELQKNMVKKRKNNEISDTLMFVEHPPVITLGRSSEQLNNLLLSRTELEEKGVELYETSRGGDITYHGPGQLVCYPILDLKNHMQDLHVVVNQYEEVLINVLKLYGIKADRKSGYTGVWVGNKKIAALGIGVKNWITYHGIALNVNNDLTPFSYIIPCGIQNAGVTSMKQHLKTDVNMEELKFNLTNEFSELFQMKPQHLFPSWLRKDHPTENNENYYETKKILEKYDLNTVCQSAECPNSMECYVNKTATFMILGENCTRNCKFCAVNRNSPDWVDPEEPQKVAQAVKDLKLKHVVITSVTRDDLNNGGSVQFAKTVLNIKEYNPNTTVEVLTPDFKGNIDAVKKVIASNPDVYNHNIETVQELYSKVRPEADYDRSLEVLAYVKRTDNRILTKSGIMVGLGETDNQIYQAMDDLRRVKCDILTIGQYLSPSDKHLKVKEYIKPSSFEKYQKMGLKLGFRHVASGPFVRSSYNAGAVLDNCFN